MFAFAEKHKEDPQDFEFSRGDFVYYLDSGAVMRAEVVDRDYGRDQISGKRKRVFEPVYLLKWGTIRGESEAYGSRASAIRELKEEHGLDERNWGEPAGPAVVRQ